MFRSLVIIGCLLGPAFAADPVIKKSAGGWKAWDKREAPAEGWTTVDFDAEGWKDASTPLGYGKEPVTTTLSFGEDGKKKYATAYLRCGFNVDEVAAGYVIKVRMDDGAVFHVNGKEVHRLNVADSIKPGEYSKFALGPGVLKQLSTLILEPDVIKEGENILAIALFQSGPTSSDLYLNLDVTPIDAETFEKMKKEAAERKKKLKEAAKKREEAEKRAAERKSAPTA